MPANGLRCLTRHVADSTEGSGSCAIRRQLLEERKRSGIGQIAQCECGVGAYVSGRIAEQADQRLDSQAISKISQRLGGFGSDLHGLARARRNPHKKSRSALGMHRPQRPCRGDSVRRMDAVQQAVVYRPSRQPRAIAKESINRGMRDANVRVHPGDRPKELDPSSWAHLGDGPTGQ